MSIASIKPRDWTTQPKLIEPDYKSTLLRGPTKPLITVPQTLSELTGPVYGHDTMQLNDADLTRNGRRSGEPLGERIIVTGRLLDEDGRGVPNYLSKYGRPTPAVAMSTSTLTTRRSIRTSSAAAVVSPMPKAVTAS